MNDLIDSCKIQGYISYQNNDINKINPMIIRKDVGMVFQNPNPFLMSIFDNICFKARWQGIKNKNGEKDRGRQFKAGYPIRWRERQIERL